MFQLLIVGETEHDVLEALSEAEQEVKAQTNQHNSLAIIVSGSALICITEKAEV